MLQTLRRLLLVVIVKPLVWLVIGFDVRGAENLPRSGPAIIAANHNSHIDTLLLLSLFPSSQLHLVRPVAAADYFLSSRFSAWFARVVVGIIPITRRAAGRDDVLAGCRDALARGEILLIFPEGTRGSAEEMSDFKTGIARLAEQFPEAPVTPVYLQGAGRVLPRGAHTPVPFNCSAIIGESFGWTGNRSAFMERLRGTVETLRQDAPPLRWL